MRYSANHCRIEKNENGVYIGLTDYAASKICKSFEIQLCEEDDFIRAGESLGEIISCEFFDIISPVSGKVIWINTELLESPSKFREELSKLRLCKITDVSYPLPLMSETEYNNFISAI